MSDYVDLSNYIKGLSEDEFRNLVWHFFKRQDLALISREHGVYEEGADIILYQTEEQDVLNKALVYLIQTKKGDIDTNVWRKSLHSQLYELYDREINLPLYNSDDIPRRIILITTGKIPDQIRKKINRMNKKNHVPIEWFDNELFVKMLVNRRYKLVDATQAVKDPNTV